MDRRPLLPYPQNGLTSRRLRISDILLTHDEDEEEPMRMEPDVSTRGDDKGRHPVECLPPSRFISRLFRRMTARKPSAAVTIRTHRGRGSGDGTGKSNAGSEVRPEEASPPAAVSYAVVPGNNNNKERAVNLGVACSLLCLTAASKNELEKMKELRREMRALLREISVDLKGKGRARESSEAVVVGSPDSCLTDAGAILRTPSIVTEDDGVAGDWPRGSGMSTQDCLKEIEELEAELEAELEQLQLHLDSDSRSTQGRPQNAAKTEDSARAMSSSISTGEVMNPLEFRGGVPPIELERKLHELLQSRQEERIKELETALEYYEHELREKDKEISRWRDTATLVSKRAKEPPSNCI